MAKILIIQHQESVPAAKFGDWLTAAGAEIDVLRPDLGQMVPGDLTGYDGLVVLGGTAAPNDDADWEWLPAVRALQRRSTEQHQPNFNICLGAQLNAVAHGTEVFRRGRPQVGVMELQVRPEAGQDPVFAAMPEHPKAVLWHQEQIANIPEGAVYLLEGTDAPVQAYRVGVASWSVQFHPEPDAKLLQRWADNSEEFLGRAGRSAEEVIEEFRAQEAEIEDSFRPVAEAFLHFIQQRKAG